MDYSGLKEALPSNNGITPKEERVVHQVTSGKVVTKKQSPVQKLFKAFIQEDVSSIKDYIIYDLIIPEVKDALLDMVRAFLYGRNGNGGKARSSGNGTVYTAYNNVSKQQPRQRVVASKPGYNMLEIVCETRDDGEAILDELAEQLATFHKVSVDELYQIAGVTNQSPTDLYWGWTDIHGACLTRTRDGWFLLNMPEPVQIR